MELVKRKQQPNHAWLQLDSGPEQMSPIVPLDQPLFIEIPPWEDIADSVVPETADHVDQPPLLPSFAITEGTSQKVSMWSTPPLSSSTSTIDLPSVIGVGVNTSVAPDNSSVPAPPWIEKAIPVPMTSENQKWFAFAQTNFEQLDRSKGRICDFPLQSLEPPQSRQLVEDSPTLPVSTPDDDQALLVAQLTSLMPNSGPDELPILTSRSILKDKQDALHVPLNAQKRKHELISRDNNRSCSQESVAPSSSSPERSYIAHDTSSVWEHIPQLGEQTQGPLVCNYPLPVTLSKTADSASMNERSSLIPCNNSNSHKSAEHTENHSPSHHIVPHEDSSIVLQGLTPNWFPKPIHEDVRSISRSQVLPNRDLATVDRPISSSRDYRPWNGTAGNPSAQTSCGLLMIASKPGTNSGIWSSGVKQSSIPMV
jgi:hypothetical protein